MWTLAASPAIHRQWARKPSSGNSSAHDEQYVALAETLVRSPTTREFNTAARSTAPLRRRLRRRPVQTGPPRGFGDSTAAKRRAVGAAAQATDDRTASALAAESHFLVYTTDLRILPARPYQPRCGRTDPIQLPTRGRAAAGSAGSPDGRRAPRGAAGKQRGSSVAQPKWETDLSGTAGVVVGNWPGPFLPPVDFWL